MSAQKIQPPKSISRINLVLTLNKQYGGNNPFVIVKDGKTEYDFLHDTLTFTCCKYTEHIHHMTPLQILQLRYINGAIPCPYCNNENGGNIKIKNISESIEDGSEMINKKKYLESDDPVEQVKRATDLQNEITRQRNEIERLSGKGKRNGPQRTKQEWEKDEEVAEDTIIDSMSVEEYERINGKNSINAVEGPSPKPIEDDIIESESFEEYSRENHENILESDMIIESESTDEYKLKNPDFKSDVSDKRFDRDINIFNPDLLFDMGVEDGVEIIEREINPEPEIKTRPKEKRTFNVTHETTNENVEENQNSKKENENILLNELENEASKSVYIDPDEEETFLD